MPSSSNRSRPPARFHLRTPSERNPRTGKPSAAPKPPKRDSEPDARPETPLRQIASDRLPSSQIAVSSPPAHLIPLIKPFLPVVPQKQGVSFYRSPKRPRGPLSSFSPKKKGERRSHATHVASQTVLLVSRLGWGPEAVFSRSFSYPGLDRPGVGRGGPHPPRLRFASTL